MTCLSAGSDTHSHTHSHGCMHCPLHCARTPLHTPADVIGSDRYEGCRYGGLLLGCAALCTVHASTTPSVCAAAWWSFACRGAEHAVARAESLFPDGPLGCAHFMWPASVPPFCSVRVLVLFPLSRWLALSSPHSCHTTRVQCTHRAHQLLARVPCDRPTETVRRLLLDVSFAFWFALQEGAGSTGCCCDRGQRGGCGQVTGNKCHIVAFM